MKLNLTPFITPVEYDRPEETYYEEARHREVAIHPQDAAPDPIRYGNFNPRRARRFLTFFMHPARDMADNFVWRPFAGRRGTPYLPGHMAAWSLRYNVYVPTPTTFGSRFEMGAPDDE